MLEKLKGNIKGKQVGKTAATEHYVFQLYIVGNSINSVRAIKNITSICETYLKNRFTLEIIDVAEKPRIANTEDIIAVPLLIRTFPPPKEKIIGDLSNTQNILDALNIVK
jgi:circadian clock protein KaiB